MPADSQAWIRWSWLTVKSLSFVSAVLRKSIAQASASSAQLAALVFRSVPGTPPISVAASLFAVLPPAHGVPGCCRLYFSMMLVLQSRMVTKAPSFSPDAAVFAAFWRSASSSHARDCCTASGGMADAVLAIAGVAVGRLQAADRNTTENANIAVKVFAIGTS